MDDSRVIAFLLSIAQIAITINARCVFGTWLAPSAFFALVWTSAIEFSLLAAPLFGIDSISPEAIVWILISTVSVHSAAIVAGSRRREIVGRAIFMRADLTRTRAALALLCSALGLGAGVSNLLAFGFHLDVFLSTESLAQTANAMSVARYSQTFDKPALSQLFLVAVYIAPLFGGSVLAIRRSWSTIAVSILSLAPSVLITAVQTEKAVTLIAEVLFVGSYLATKLSNGDSSLFTRRRVIVGTSLASITLVFACMSMLARLGSTDIGLLTPVVIPKMAGYVFGPFVAFSEWLRISAGNQDGASFGAYTFAGIFEQLGIHQRDQGLFSDYIQLSSGYLNNVYTCFRPLIEDFAALGSIGVMFVGGYLATIAFLRTYAGSYNWRVILSAFYSSVMFGLLSSIWAYNTVVAAFLLYAWLNARICHSGPRSNTRERAGLPTC